MQENTAQVALSAFAQEVTKGLTDYPKHLSSKYFYDKKGDKLFQQIMAMPEYYLTDCEFEILETHKEAIAKRFAVGTGAFSLFELGAGDGKKTKILLKYLSEQGYDFEYCPIDISQNALDNLSGSIAKELPKVAVKPLQGTYFECLKTLGAYNGRRKVILFLGSNIGNLLHDDAIDFLTQLKNAMAHDDLLFMGMDQKKDPQTILNAYNDAAGITEAFNKNIFTRINAELGGNFNLDDFFHWEMYNPETGTAKSFMVSKKKQTITIEQLNLKVDFQAWETIHTEISQKYDDNVVAWLANTSGLKVVQGFTDKKSYFKDYILTKSHSDESNLER